jgi:hypothetical protein
VIDLTAGDLCGSGSSSCLLGVAPAERTGAQLMTFIRGVLLCVESEWMKV